MSGEALADPHGRGVAVSTHGLVHIYRADGRDVAALSGVDLVVGAGEMVGLLGPSGAGKSTLLTLFGGLLRPSAGRIRIGGTDIGALDEAGLDEFRAIRVGLVLQGAGRNLMPYLSPRENLRFAQRASRGSAHPIPAPEEILDLVGLADRADSPLTALTPGQVQLTAVAVAIANGPGLLLGDEPTSQLDHEARDVVLGALHTINRELGTTVVVVTHDPEVAGRLPRTVTIRDGRVGGEGRAGEEFAVVAADGSLPLPAAVLDVLPPGTLVRLHQDGARWSIVPGDQEPPSPAQPPMVEPTGSGPAEPTSSGATGSTAGESAEPAINRPATTEPAAIEPDLFRRPGSIDG